MKTLSFLIKPASTSCNLKCKYCFYTDVSEHRENANMGVMSNETMHNLIDKAFTNLDENGQITFAFQGGEPTMVGIRYFNEFTDYVNKRKKDKQNVIYSIQTNATKIDDDWAKLFKKYNFLVGISLDGYKENHDFFRITKKNGGSFNTVMKSIELLKKYEVEFNILTVLSKQLAKHPTKLYEFYKKYDFRYVQLIPCLNGLEDDEDLFSLTPKLFSEFYKKFYNLWLSDFEKGIYRSFNLFDNLLLMLKDQPPYQCGLLGFCSIQLVIEGDGSIYPCDFYVLDKYKGGNINTDTLEDVMKNMMGFLKEKKTLCSSCANCEYINICHGNCKRMGGMYFSEDYCGYQDFLKYAIPSMIQVVRYLR